MIRAHSLADAAGYLGVRKVRRAPPLSPAEEVLFRQRIEAEPQRNEEICSWRGVDCQRFLETQFGKQMSLSAVYWLLHRLDDEWLVPRPKHQKSGPVAMSALKKIPEQLAEIKAQHSTKNIVVFFQDECRFGQQGTLTRKWAKRGSRPTAVR